MTSCVWVWHARRARTSRAALLLQRVRREGGSPVRARDLQNTKPALPCGTRRIWSGAERQLGAGGRSASSQEPGQKAKYWLIFKQITCEAPRFCVCALACHFKTTFPLEIFRAAKLVVLLSHCHFASRRERKADGAPLRISNLYRGGRRARGCPERGTLGTVLAREGRPVGTTPTAAQHEEGRGCVNGRSLRKTPKPKSTGRARALAAYKTSPKHPSGLRIACCSGGTTTG
jgi:hypothetical protein